VAPNRTELLTVRMTPDELAMLKELADADGISASDFVRQFVRRAHGERGGAKPRPKPKRK
jgi:hypothetical protein